MTWPTMPAWLTWERVAWVVVLVFGTGIYGTWSQRDIEKQRIVMDARKQAVELGEQENKVLVQIVEVTSILQRIEAASGLANRILTAFRLPDGRACSNFSGAGSMRVTTP